MAKPKDAKVETPTCIAAAADLLAKLGDLVKLQADIANEADVAIRRIALHAAADSAPIGAKVAAIRKALKRWADKYRDTLVVPGTKTVRLPTGELAWRDTPEALQITEGFEEAEIIAALRKAGYGDCVRVVQELDKPEIKKLWPHLAETHIAGLRLVSGEVFQLKPLSIAEPIEMKTKTVNVVDELDGKPRKEKSK